MEVTVNGTIHEVPFDLMLITLEEFLKYQEEYGKDLTKAYTALLSKKYEDEDEEMNELQKALDFENYLDDEALAWFSFWTKTDFFEAREQPGIAPLLESFRVMQYLIKEEENELEKFPLKFNWDGEEWEVENYAINPSSQMASSEVITSKETIRQLYAMGKGRWEALPYLCSVFFRKKGEPFEDDMIMEGGERMELLKKMPLKYAFQVSFFLSCCVSIWSKTLVSSTTTVDQEIAKLN